MREDRRVAHRDWPTNNQAHVAPQSHVLVGRHWVPVHPIHSETLLGRWEHLDGHDIIAAHIYRTRDIEFIVAVRPLHLRAVSNAFAIHPNAGRILVEGVEITHWPPNQIAQAGVARTFQRNNLFFNLSVLENLQLAVAARRSLPWNFWSVADRISPIVNHAETLLARVQITGDPRRLVRNLSYGEQRQLEIGVALAADPILLLLDEPTSGMSPAETDRMMALIGNLPRTLTVLMIEHDMNVVFTVADRITVLHYGEVLASGPPDVIRSESRVREVYLGTRH